MSTPTSGYAPIHCGSTPTLWKYSQKCGSTPVGVLQQCGTTPTMRVYTPQWGHPTGECTFAPLEITLPSGDSQRGVYTPMDSIPTEAMGTPIDSIGVPMDSMDTPTDCTSIPISSYTHGSMGIARRSGWQHPPPQCLILYLFFGWLWCLLCPSHAPGVSWPDSGRTTV